MARKAVAFALALLTASAILTARGSTAPDVTGKWTGTIAIPGDTKRQKSLLFASFKQNGVELTGAIGPTAEAQLPISKGEIETTKYGTVIRFQMAGPSFVMRFELIPAGEVLRGVARLDGEKATAPVELQKEAPAGNGR